MNKLIVMSGIPGSGKSYISLLIKKRKNNEHVYIVSSDKIRNLISGNQQNFNHEDLTWKMYYELAKCFALDKDGIVILDSTNSLREYRIEKVKSLVSMFDEVNLVLFKLDKATVMKQNVEREFPIPNDVLEHLIDTFEDINEEDKKFFDKIYVVDSNDLNKIVENIVK